jgi:hypothetical protein
MAESLVIRTNNAGAYLYIENAAANSLAIGSDAGTNTFNVNTLATANAIPDEATSNFAIDATANGDIAFLPNGTGLSDFVGGDVRIAAGNLQLPATNDAGTQGVITNNGNNFLSAPGTSNLYLGESSGTIPNVVNLDYNIGLGYQSMNNLGSGANQNVGIGSSTLQNVTGGDNICLGNAAGQTLTSANNNIIIGSTNSTITTGDNNILLNGGTNYTGAESANIIIGNDGIVGESNVIRIGNGQLRAFIDGIHAVTPAGATQTMIINSSGQIGSTTAGGGATNFVTNAGTATQVGGSLSVLGGSNLGSTGAGSTVTINLDDTVSISGSMTAGTGLTATTGNITAAVGNLVATSGLITMPVTDTGITEGAINMGGARFMHKRGTRNVFLGTNAGNASFTVSGSEDNVFIGENAGDAMSTNCRNNVVVGYNALGAATDTRGNVAIGYLSLNSVTSGSLANTAIGQNVLDSLTGGAGFNTGCGSIALNAIATGAYNTALGNGAGASLTLADSDNICIMNAGTVGDNNTLRLGTQGTGNGQIDTTFVAGIYNVGVTNDGMVIIDSAGQLGSQLNLVMPENVAFLAYNSADDVDQTGDGAVATVDFDTEVFDQGSDFSADTFTAPVTGRYQLTARVSVTNFTSARLLSIQLVTSNRSYYGDRIDPLGTTTSDGDITIGVSVLADMDAADTATVQVVATGEGADTNDIMGSASPHETYFSGYLAS